jgi:diguanylate cyclase (GGDEF)-like protein/PAS domain S-box-containing protein
MNANTPATILIVDDERQNCKLLETLLRSEGYVTVIATNGEEALEAVTQQTPDLILLDIMMPGMDGYQVAKILKGNPSTSTIPIIMVTALIDRNARLAGLNAGAEEFLTKPVDRAELWLRVRNLLRLKALGDFLKDHSSILEQQVRARTADLQRFRTAMDATADAICLVNRTTMRFIELNATACAMLGYSCDELHEMSPQEVSTATLEELERVYDALIAGHTTGELSEIRLRHKDGSFVLVEARRQVHRFGADWIVVEVLRDITERKEAEKRLHHLAHYDALTGLPNRVLFHETLRKTLVQASESGWLVAVLCIDLDHFKNVNDTLGHAIGDELLVQVANRLTQCVRIRDTVGRLGGDEFALILVMQDGQQGAANVADKIRNALQRPMNLKGHDASITASIGITLHPDDATDPETLMKYADTAMYRAKQAGRDTFRFFTAQMNIDVVARLELEKALRKAVENEEFVLHYQPKVALVGGRITGIEALLRWQRPGHGLVPPKDFIPALEETGLIVRVGSWVIAAACKQIGLWARSSIGPVSVSVNVAGRQFIEGDLDSDVIRALEENAIASELLELELTESSLMANTERTIACLKKLKSHGVSISIDDFGTGYSSLAYLRRFPIDKLKIDVAFIRDVTSNPDDAAIVLAIIRMAHSLKLDAIAEGVETAGQLGYLRRHGCDQIQGYLFSPPVPVAELEPMLLADRRLPPPEDETPAPMKTLLLVDDDAETLAELQHLLRTDGYRLLCANSAAKGFEMLALNDVQVILCDQSMPLMEGTVFLDRVRDLYPDTFRVILSGHSDPEGIMEAINRGAIHRYYTKPWDKKALRDYIRQAFSHHRLLHGLASERRAVEELEAQVPDQAFSARRSA